LGNVVGQDVVEGLDQQGAGQQALREFARTDLVGVEFGDPPFPGRVVVAGVQYGPAVQQFSGQRVVRAQRDAEHGCLTGLRSLLHGARGGARAQLFDEVCQASRAARIRDHDVDVRRHIHDSAAEPALRECRLPSDPRDG
jgi:hypothetical protein